MIVQYKAELKDIEHGAARINIQGKLEGVYEPLLALIFEAILRSMKDTDEHAFYEAMANFAEEDLDDLRELIHGENDDD